MTETPRPDESAAASIHGTGLIPGWNTDRVDVAAGLEMAKRLGYGDPTAQMVAEFALMLHRRGEEDNAQRAWLGQYPRDLTSWYAILAHAITAARRHAHENSPWPDGTRVVFTPSAKQAMTQHAPSHPLHRYDLRTPNGGADAVYTIDNTDDTLHDVILRENGERWGEYWLANADPFTA